MPIHRATEGKGGKVQALREKGADEDGISTVWRLWHAC